MRMTQGMPVSRIVFATIAPLGDLHPKISLALELRARGHEVAFGLPFSRLRPNKYSKG
jgi:hypothetical protein